MVNKGSPELEYYSIFCGVFLYNGRKLNGSCRPWIDRLSSSNLFYEHVNRNYYQNYFNNVLKNGTANAEQTNTSFQDHTTLASLLGNPVEGKLPLTEPIKFSIPYFDCFLFTDGIGIFCFKVEFPSSQSSTYQTIAQSLAYLRNPESIIHVHSKSIKMTQFIQEKLEEGHRLPEDWNQYLPQLKFYCIINDPSINRFSKTEDQALFELAHTMPAGTIQADLNDKPSDVYYHQIMNSNTIAIYDNWKAICLLDSFTRISCNYPDTYKTWELDYFHIYVHCLFSKFQLYYFNTQLTDLLQFNKKTQSIRDRFVKFVNDYSLTYISYKFLPNILYEKINYSLDIQKEQHSMENKIERLNESYQNKKSKQLNSLLLVISILSLASVMNDISQWLTNMGTPAAWVYNPLTTLAAVSVLAIIAWISFWKK